MRKQYLFLIVLVAALLLGSCDLFKKGGSIEVTNQAGDPITNQNLVIIVKGAEFLQAIEDIKNNKGTQMYKGNKKTFTYDEDGVYTVVALFPDLFHETVTLLGGGIQRVTIK
ncbi:hypothetical protein R84B8_00477 [Treponema sp. R8-4-B8]